MDVNSAANRGVLLANMPEQLLFASGWFKSLSDLVMQFLRSQTDDDCEAITADLQLFKLLRAHPETITPEKVKALSLKYAPQLKNNWVDSKVPDEKEMKAIGAWWLLKIALDVFLSKKSDLQFERLNEFLADEKKAVEVCRQQQNTDNIGPYIAKWIGEGWENSIEFEVRKILLWLAFYEKFIRATTDGFEQRFSELAMMKMFLPVAENDKLVLSNERYVSAIKQKQVGAEASWGSFYEKIAEARNTLNSGEVGDLNDAVERAIKRIRAGETPLSRANYVRNLRVLDTELRQVPLQPVELIALFCEVMTQKQTMMRKNGFPAKYIEKVFSVYPMIYERFTD